MLQSTDEVILRMAWKRLWTPDTLYYLPNVMANGVQSGSFTIPPLEGSPIDKLGPIQLFKNDVLGYISLIMENSRINGLPSIADRGLTYDDSTHTLTLSVAFDQLLYRGNYEVDSGGVTGCAIAAANNILNMFNSVNFGNNDDNIDLAYQYRDTLSKPDNPNGNVLVDIFYNQNNTLNTIVMAENAEINGQPNPANGFFQDRWLHEKTGDKDTSFFMKQTSEAANNPDNQGTGFNDDDYNGHGFYMTYALTVEALELIKLGDPRGQELYDALYNSPSADVKSKAGSDSSIMDEAEAYYGDSINNFMEYVQKGGSVSLSGEERDASIKHKAGLREQAKAKVERDYQDWIANNRYEEYNKKSTQFASVNDVVQVTGYFSDTFDSPAVTITATVKTVDGNLVVTINEIDADIPQLHVILYPDIASDLNTEVQNMVANASFLINLLKNNIEGGLNSDDVKNYLSDRFNQAIEEIFG
ncbi:hypothetical protein FAM09_23090 [Niastella caeni]|uniref:Uncharacterized protein n=1 Tax=Niastella caeni TaxID=2569763 RepID=A0A4S8HJU1_9BACT|nr:hypothetical protein [Niastella caeni]THU34881.1 hypothetical protein FAM09_23090 [Niastella caeni]